MSESSHALLNSLSLDPQLALFAVAADAAGDGGELGEETLDEMAALVERGGLADLDPRRVWPVLARGLMSTQPSRMLSALTACGALARLLPELAALFGRYQTGFDGEPVDIGLHQGRVVDAAAARNAPLRVRLAALLCNLGKADSPPQHLPAHYRHIDRCLPRIVNVCARFGIAAELEDFAILVAMELERVHRATRMRAGSLTALLERVDAFGELARFEDLLTVCACDYFAYPGNTTPAYPKAALLRQALAACLAADQANDDDETPRHERRAMAVAQALHSCRDE
ncbi:MAG: tRNA nucleotidyltransferase [Azonexus sp.]|jgi:tRNA nucleotidyltransferase (CCA-adding enzyme)|nr:tRNA nucleotidyltransferase [Azonexus sp.]